VQQLIAEYYEQVLIYGDRTVFDPVTAYSFPRAVAERTQFCGYVFSQENMLSLENFDWPFLPRERRSRPVVLATAGGGEDGFRTLEAFMRATAGAPWDAVGIAGPMTPDAELAALEKLAAQSGVTFRHYVPHLSALFSSVDALVCMGGYNTLVEAAALGVPTVCVPRVTPRVEQVMRAEAFERLGLLQVCRPEHLSSELLRSKIEAALRASPERIRARAHAHLSFNGARRAAEYLLKLRSAGSAPTSRSKIYSETPQPPPTY
jgi:predicted glycosyltransferase